MMNGQGTNPLTIFLLALFVFLTLDFVTNAVMDILNYGDPPDIIKIPLLGMAAFIIVYPFIYGGKQ